MCIGQLGCSFLYYYFISFHMNSSHILKQNSSKQIIPKEITRPNLRNPFEARLNTSGQRKNITLMKHRTTISKMKTAISFYFFSLISFGDVVFFPLAFTLFLFKTYNLIWLFSSIFWLVGSVCCGNRASKRHM